MNADGWSSDPKVVEDSRRPQGYGGHGKPSAVAEPMADKMAGSSSRTAIGEVDRWRRTTGFTTKAQRHEGKGLTVRSLSEASRGPGHPLDF